MKRIGPLCALAITLAVTTLVHAEYAGIGRTPSEAEVRAWDIDVRPDFEGLPPGHGTVAEGEVIWAERCASCHGDFGDANHVFTPLVGNTTAEDVHTGRVSSLKKGGSYRTTFTKVSSVSTLWDYIYRAMPWDRPKSLSVNEVYAVLAYLLHLADVVPSDFELTQESIAQAQARMPNRDGMTRDHGLWTVEGRPDTRNTACMRNCLSGPVEVTSSLPDHARGSHGDLAQQNRTFGPVRGIVTADPSNTPVTDAAQQPAASSPTGQAIPLLSSNGCMGCHAIDSKGIGPAFVEIAAKYREREGADAYLASKIREGSRGVWGGPVPMPAFPQLSDETISVITQWIARGAGP